jgi:hypothetical protein
VSHFQEGFMTVDEMKETADPDAIVWDGFDRAIVGIDRNGRVVYNIPTMIDILVTDDDMAEDEAFEYLDHNVLNTHVGELTPVHVYVLW